jgi:hypothetical protein
MDIANVCQFSPKQHLLVNWSSTLFILPLNTGHVLTRSAYLSFSAAASEKQQTVPSTIYLRDVESILNLETAVR